MVYQRNYLEELNRGTSKPVWAYAFSYKKVRYRESGYHSKREAQHAEQIARQQAMFGQRLAPSKSKREFCSLSTEVLDHRLRTCALSTVKCEHIRKKSLTPFLGGRNVADISAADVQRWIRRRKDDGISPRTINLELNFLRVLFRYALQHRLIEEDPMRDIGNLTEPRKERPIMTPADFQRLLNETTKLPNSEELSTWLIFRVLTATRPSEALFVSWSDLDFEKNLLTIQAKNGNPLKKGAFRHIPLHPELRKSLLTWRGRWLEEQKKHGFKHDWVFFYPANPHERSQGFRRSFATACQKAGIKMRNYDLRHYALSQMVMSGCDLMAITKIAGHGSVATLEKIYCHLRPEYLSGQIQKLKLPSIGQSLSPPSAAKSNQA